MVLKRRNLFESMLPDTWNNIMKKNKRFFSRSFKLLLFQLQVRVGLVVIQQWVKIERNFITIKKNSFEKLQCALKGNFIKIISSNLSA